MKKKLSKEQLAERSALAESLRAAAQNITDAVDTYNQTVLEAQTPVQQALTAYNEVVEKAKVFANEVAEELQGEFDERSEKWQESDAGESFQGWITEWDNATLDEAEIDFPDEVESPPMEEADTLESLAEEVQ